MLSIALGAHELDAIAPFAIVCAGDLTIERIGPSLRKALGRDLAGREFFDEFEVHRPHGVRTGADVRASTGISLHVRTTGGALKLRYQPILVPGGDRIIFFGSLVLTDEADLARIGLGFQDFALADPTPDLLLIRRTQDISLRDLATLNVLLERSALEQHTVKAALAVSERRYRTLVEQQPLVTYTDELGEDVTTTFTSRNVVDLAGYSAEQWTSIPNFLLTILHPDDNERVLQSHVEATRNGGSFKADFRLIAADGRTVWVKAEDRVVVDDDGVPLYRLGYMLNVTEQRAAEDALREMSVRAQTLIESTPVAIMMEDEHRRVALVNAAFCSLFELPVAPADIIGTDWSDSAERSKHLMADPGLYVARVAELVAGRETVTQEQLLFADGRMHSWDYVPTFVGDSCRGRLWVYRDITPQIAMERETTTARDQAIAASVAKSEFLATVSHEIRTPMHGILGTLDLLQGTLLDPEQADLLAVVSSSALALLAIINDILDLQHAESGHLELVNEPLDIRALVEGVIGVMRASATKKKNVQLRHTIDTEVPTDLVGDGGRLRQVLLNLIANAVKFTETGTITLDVRTSRASARSATISFVVTDTGVGIAPAYLKTIFEPFTQADSSSTRRHEGTGLGLSITRQLVLLMDGEIKLHSAPDVGTTVTVALPLRRERRRSSDNHDPFRDERRRAAEAHGFAGTVLVVEDHDDNRELVVRQLAHLGVTSDAVASGRASIEAVKHGNYSLILMDIRMPDVNGLVATNAIRAWESAIGHQRTPIIALTANAMPQDRATCLAAGMDDFATKPLRLVALTDIVRRWLSVAAAPKADEHVPAGVYRTLEGIANDLGKDAVERITDLWLERLPIRVGALRVAQKSRDAARVRETAHLLKSTCSLIGASHASMLAAELEERSVHEQPVHKRETEALLEALERAADLVRAWRAGVRDAS